MGGGAAMGGGSATGGGAASGGGSGSPCQSIASTLTETDFRAAFANLGPTIDFSGLQASVRNLNWQLPSLSGDPAVPTLARLHQQAPALFPLSLVIVHAGQPMDQVLLTHENFRRMAYIVRLEQRMPGEWSISSISVDGALALATPAQLANMAACTPMNPMPALASSATLTGSMMVGCAEVGRYSYSPNANDAVTWLPEQGWEVVNQRWTWVRSATLVLNASNYWADINQADCRCPGEVGFRIDVDGFSGELVRYQPGISCVVC